jgi:hypothetical protein
MIKFTELKTWQESHSSIWRELISRFGQADYDNEEKRTKNIATLKSEWETAKYQRERSSDYPTIGDQLDMIYHAGQGGDAFQKAIKAIKDKYPKG